MYSLWYWFEGRELLEDSGAGSSGSVRAPAAWRRHVSGLLMFDTRLKRRKDPKETVPPSGRLSGRLLRVRTAGEVNGTSRKLRSATVKQSVKKGYMNKSVREETKEANAGH